MLAPLLLLLPCLFLFIAFCLDFSLAIFLFQRPAVLWLLGLLLLSSCGLLERIGWWNRLLRSRRRSGFLGLGNIEFQLLLEDFILFRQVFLIVLFQYILGFLRFRLDFFLFLFLFLVSGDLPKELPEDGTLVEGVEIQHGKAGFEDFLGFQALHKVVFLGDDQDGGLDLFFSPQLADEGLAPFVGFVIGLPEGATCRDEGKGKLDGLVDERSERLAGLGAQQAGIPDLGQFL